VTPREGTLARLPRPRAILFDWDNTLVDSWPTIHEALNFCMSAMGKPCWSLEQTKERVRLSLRDSFPHHFGDRWEEARTVYLGRFREIHLERLTALPDRETMLHGLVGEGIFLGVVSNKTGALLRREVERLGWCDLFGSVVGAGDASADKPACEPILLALASSGIRPGEDVWYVGDTAIDIECACKTGCVSVLLGVDAQAAEFVQCPSHLAFPDAQSLFRGVRDL